MKNIKEVKKWLHSIMKSHMSDAVAQTYPSFEADSDPNVKPTQSELHGAVILEDGTILLTTHDGKYFTIKVSAGQK